MKTRTIYLSIMLSFVLGLSSQLLKGQESQKLTKIETKDGNEFVGILMSEDSVKVVLQTEALGEINIKKDVIKKRTEIDPSKIIGGELWDDNPQATRYLWTPNGYGLKAGEGYYQNIWVLYNQVSVGMSENFSMSAGIIPLFFFALDFSPVWIVPKFSIPLAKDKVNMSAGAFVGTILGESESGFGIVFSTLTLGNRNNNWNFGLGWGYAGGEWADRPIINISGMARGSAHGYFLTENYYIPQAEMVLLSGGYRYMAKNVGIDFGLYLPISSEVGDFIVFPLLGITIPFESSKKK